MEMYGIKTPGTKEIKPYVWWLSNDPHTSWDMFFTYPNKDRGLNFSRAPAEEAKRAYKAIGYKCVKLEVTEQS